MSPREPNRWLKLKTRQLVKACGGLEEASNACEAACRPYSVPHLSRAQNASYPDCYLPIDIVHALEAYCGEPIVSAAMAESRPWGEPVGNVRDEMAEVIERGADIGRALREVMADGRIEPREEAELSVMLDALSADVSEVRAALRHAARAPGAAGPTGARR